MAFDSLSFLQSDYPILHTFLKQHWSRRASEDLAIRSIADAILVKQEHPACVEIDLVLAQHYIDSGMVSRGYKLIEPYCKLRTSPNSVAFEIINPGDLSLPLLAKAACRESDQKIGAFVSLAKAAGDQGIVAGSSLLRAARYLAEQGAWRQGLELSHCVLEMAERVAEKAGAVELILEICLDCLEIECARELIRKGALKNTPHLDPNGFISKGSEADETVLAARLAHSLGRPNDAVELLKAGLIGTEETAALADMACLAWDLGDTSTADQCIEIALDHGLHDSSPQFTLMLAQRFLAAGHLRQAADLCKTAVETGAAPEEVQKICVELARAAQYGAALEDSIQSGLPQEIMKARKHIHAGEYAKGRKEYLLYKESQGYDGVAWEEEVDAASKSPACLEPNASFIDEPYPREVLVLVAAPVRQKHEILRKFLEGLSGLDLEHKDFIVKPDFVFVDDNIDPESTDALHRFHPPWGRVYVAPFSRAVGGGQEYTVDNETHRWNSQLIDKVGALKDFIIEFALKQEYDYVFFVDSDLVLHRSTLIHLVSLERDIVSEVFWTKWQPDQPELPQVWQMDQYCLAKLEPGESLDEKALSERAGRFVMQLRIPGLYPVGGLGACTLISKRALERGARFARLDNVSFWGEDRYFSIRARALGLELYADTTYPPFHIYRDSLLAKIEDPGSAQTGRLPTIRFHTSRRTPRITLSMLVRNEANRYLERVLKSAAPLVDNAVILDDASEDDTIGECARILETVGLPFNLVSNKSHGFANEVALRKQQWDLAIASGAEWVLCLDADEVFETAARVRLRRLVEYNYADAVAFRLFDMWDKHNYRDDPLWNAHTRYACFLVKHRPGAPYFWRETPLHCGRFPSNITDRGVYCSDLRLKHLGWSSKEDRAAKYERYMQHDPDGEYGDAMQYRSILDPNPRLSRWRD